MGVQGLLTQVRSCVQRVSLSDFSERTLAVDASGWLHRGALVCAHELLLGEPTDQYLAYPLRMLDLFERHGVTPLLVFDGASLPAKAAVHRARSGVRAAARARAAAAAIEADAEAARRKTVVVTAEMARTLIEVLRARGHAFVVAPYEADAQCAFLVREGHAHAAVSDPRCGTRTLVFRVALERTRHSTVFRAHVGGIRPYSAVSTMRSPCPRGAPSTLHDVVSAPRPGVSTPQCLRRCVDTAVLTPQVTDDSDLVAYGCPRVLYKLQARAGASPSPCPLPLSPRVC